MHIRKASVEQGSTQLQNDLITHLKRGERVLWLIPGGSNIPFTVEIMANIPEDLTASLTLALTDERYGGVGHQDSNWKQLAEAGFESKQATTIHVLHDGLETLPGTTQAYDEALQSLLASHDFIIGQFGMGADGHIAGILPGTPATNAHGYAVGYKTDTFERITSTFQAIRHCNIAYLFAYGDNKLEALQNLERELPLDQQPAQILKEIPEAYVYNDQIGDEI